MVERVRPAGEAELERCVLRVVEAGQPTSQPPLGTAFPLAPGVLLTCAHVVMGREPTELKLLSDHRDANTIDVCAVVLHPQWQHLDVALLTAKQAELPEPLPATATKFGWGNLRARGFGGEPGHAGARSLRPEVAGAARVWYVCGAPDGSETEFSVDEALVLKGDPSRPGDSGGPVLELSAGAVIGLMAGGPGFGERSFVVPLHRAVEGFPDLTEALAWNDSQLPRFGSVLNPSGAAALCNAQVAAALSALEERALFDMGRLVKRPEAERVIEEFLAGKAPAIAVRAAPGSGKTALLAMVAAGRWMCGRSMLIRGVSVDAKRGPVDAVAAALVEAAPSCEAAPERLAEVLAAVGSPLVLLLDAINEVSHRDWAPEWLNQAISWCEHHKVRLVVSCRVELWPLFCKEVRDAPRRLYHPGTLTRAPETKPPVTTAPVEERGLRLGDFSVEEAAQAAVRYGLGDDAPTRIGMHPLMYPLAAELQFGAEGSRIGRFQLIDEFVDHRLRRVVARLGFETPVPLRMWLERIAERLSTGTDGALTSISPVQAEDARIADALVGEGLLYWVRRGVLRFLHDEVAEALRPVGPDPETVFATLDLDASISPTVLREATTALLRLEADQNEKAYRLGIASILAAAEHLTLPQGGPGQPHPIRRHGLIKNFSEALSHLFGALPATRAADIDQIANVLSAAPRIDALSAMALGELVAKAPLSPARRADLLFNLSAHEHHYEYRWKMFADPRRRAGAADLTLRRVGLSPAPAWIADLLRRYGSVIRSVALSRLRDNTPLAALAEQSSEATIGDVAAHILLRCDHNTFEMLDALLGMAEIGALEPAARRPERLLSAIATAEPVEAALFALAELDGCRAFPAFIFVLRHALHELTNPPADVDQQSYAYMVDLVRDATEDLLGHSDRKLVIEAALTLRVVFKDELATWDILAAEALADGVFSTGLAPIPPGRLQKAIQVIRHRRDWDSLYLLQTHHGTIEEAIELSSLAVELWQERDCAAFDELQMAMLAENRVMATKTDPTLAPWRNLLAAIEISGHGPGLDYLVRKGLLQPERGTKAADDVLLGLVMGMLTSEGPSESWVPEFIKSYDNASEAGRALAKKRLFGGRSYGKRSIAEAVLTYWATSGDEYVDVEIPQLIGRWRAGVPADECLREAGGS